MKSSNRIRLTLALPLVLLISACGQHIVKPPKTVVLAPPSALTEDCKVDAPPALKISSKNSDSPDQLIKMLVDNIHVLVKAWNSQTLNVGNCNKDKKGIRDWKTQTTSILKSTD